MVSKVDQAWGHTGGSCKKAKGSLEAPDSPGKERIGGGRSPLRGLEATTKGFLIPNPRSCQEGERPRIPSSPCEPLDPLVLKSGIAREGIGTKGSLRHYLLFFHNSGFVRTSLHFKRDSGSQAPLRGASVSPPSRVTQPRAPGFGYTSLCAGGPIWLDWRQTVPPGHFG
eukprot:scaffold686_cov437-Pavlova_lutheri.AAC.5